MGLFDFFKGKSGKAGTGNTERPRASDKNVARYADAISKKAQNYDRQEAIEGLAKIGSAEAATALLKRFTFVVDPSITDQEEKETAFRGIVAAGKDALPAIREFCVKAESLTWPLRMMRELLADDGLRRRGPRACSRSGTPSTRATPTRRSSSSRRSRRSRTRASSTRSSAFLEDVNEPTRFHAVTTLLAQDDRSRRGPARPRARPRRGDAHA